MKVKAFEIIRFYNQCKRTILRSGGAEETINLTIFTGLIKELRIKLDCTKNGLGPNKTEREINFGLSSNLTSDPETKL